MDDFHVLLPSNVKCNEANTPSKFMVTFDEPIRIDDTNDWEVGLIEIDFKNCIKTIHQDYAQITKTTVSRKLSKTNQRFKYLPHSFGKLNPIKNSKWYFKEDDQEPISEWVGIPYKSPAFFTEDGEDKLSFYISNGKIVLVNGGEFDVTLTILKSLALILGFVASSEKMLYNDEKFTFDRISKLGGKIEAPHAMLLGTNAKDGHQNILCGPVHAPRQNSHPLGYDIEYHTEITSTQTVATVYPKPGTYTNAKDLETELNKESSFKKYVEFSYDERLNRMDMKTIAKDLATYAINFQNGLHDVLGFSKTNYLFRKDPYKGELEVSIMRGISSLFIYCDICEPIRVGNTQAPLLRTVAYNAQKYGQMIHSYYTNPMYVKVNKTFIDTIQIMICDAAGDVIPFVEGLTTVLLHFKRI